MTLIFFIRPSNLGAEAERSYFYSVLFYFIFLEGGGQFA